VPGVGGGFPAGGLGFEGGFGEGFDGGVGEGLVGEELDDAGPLLTPWQPSNVAKNRTVTKGFQSNQRTALLRFPARVMSFIGYLRSAPQLCSAGLSG